MFVQLKFRTALAKSSAMDLPTSAALIAFSHVVAPVESAASCEYPLSYFFIKSNTTAVMAFTPVLRVGSGSGANKLECREGNCFADSFLGATFGGSLCL